MARNIDGNRKTYTFGAATLRHDSGIDADQPTARRDQRAIRIAWVDGGNRPDEILKRIDAEA
jgi:hypothetical protein